MSSVMNTSTLLSKCRTLEQCAEFEAKKNAASKARVEAYKQEIKTLNEIIKNKVKGQMRAAQSRRKVLRELIQNEYDTRSYNSGIY